MAWRKAGVKIGRLADECGGAGPEVFKGAEESRPLSQQFLHAVFRANNIHGKFNPAKILLIGKVAIEGYERIELCGYQPQKFAVLK
jgi:hypothetical protein